MTVAKQLRDVQIELEAAVTNLPLANRAEDIVPGEGASTADIIFIGEAPGHHESVERRPFVGRSGKLLRQVITDIGLLPEQYYITNIIKVRPPDNRDPLPEEIAAFRPYLNREIAILQPELIVTLGRYSMAKFLPDVKISQVHGRLHQVIWQEKNQYVLPMYHPAAALRSTRTKEQFIADMTKIPRVLDWLRQKKKVSELRKQVIEAVF